MLRLATTSESGTDWPMPAAWAGRCPTAAGVPRRRHQGLPPAAPAVAASTSVPVRRSGPSVVLLLARLLGLGRRGRSGRGRRRRGWVGAGRCRRCRSAPVVQLADHLDEQLRAAGDRDGDPAGVVLDAGARARAEPAAPRLRRGSRSRSCTTTSTRSPPTWALSSSEVPWAMTWPWSMTAMSSARWSASSRYCVVSSSVAPSRTSSRMTSHMSRRLRGSRPGGRLVEEQHGRRTTSAPRGRAGVACRRSRSCAGRSAASARSNCSSSSPRAPLAAVRSHLVEPADHLEVLAAGQVLVDRGVLPGQADEPAHLLRCVDDVDARRRSPCPRRAAAASSGPARWWSCRRRSGRAGRARVPSGTSRSTPSSARTEPFLRPPPNVLPIPSALMARSAMVLPSPVVGRRAPTARRAAPQPRRPRARPRRGGSAHLRATVRQAPTRPRGPARRGPRRTAAEPSGS